MVTDYKELYQVLSTKNIADTNSLVETAKKQRISDITSLFDRVDRLDLLGNGNDEFSVGGLGVHRGFYNPSLIDDLVTGNVNRGRLLKRKTVKSKPTYRYLYDQHGVLKSCWHYCYNPDFPAVPEIELLTHSTDTIMGITYELEWNTIRNISEEKYRDGRLETYTNLLVLENRYYPLSVTEAYQETYSYNDKSHLTCDVCIYSPNINKKPLLHNRVVPLVRLIRYSFEIETNKLRSYTAMEISEKGIKDAVGSNHSFLISKPRFIC